MFFKQERPEMDDFEEEKNVGPFHYFKVNYKAPEKKKMGKCYKKCKFVPT